MPVSRVSRRRVVQAATLALPWLRTARADDGPLRLAQSTALTGPLGDLGTAMHQGAVAAFDGINARGGVNGRPIDLRTLDDAYEVPKAMANIDRFLADGSFFALFNCMGTPMVEAMLPKVQASGLPFFAPFTGALLSRTSSRSVFNIRASYADEADRIIHHLAALGLRRVALAYQNNTFGREVFAAVKQQAGATGVQLLAATTVDNDSRNAASAAQRLAEVNPEAVIAGLAGQPCLAFIKAFRPLRRGVLTYALSVLGTTDNVRALGEDAIGLNISQVVPLPSNVAMPLVREFGAAWKARGYRQEPSPLALEGYINARVFAETLQRAGRNPSRAAFIDASWSLRRWDLGGFPINATAPDRSASQFVELTLVDRKGRFMR